MQLLPVAFREHFLFPVVALTVPDDPISASKLIISSQTGHVTTGKYLT